MRKNKPSFEGIEECEKCPLMVIAFAPQKPTCPLNNNKFRGFYGDCNPKLCEGGKKRYNY